MNIKKAILLANVLLTGLVIWGATNVFFFWSSSRAKAGPTPEAGRIDKVMEAKSLQNPRTLKEYETLIRHDIFSAAKSTSKAPIKEVKIAQTNLDLTLKGTAVGKEHESYAIILDNKTKKQDLYYVNTSIQGARISNIEQDRVILDVNGRQEALILSEKRTASRRPRTSPVRGASTLRRSQNIRPPGVGGSNVRRPPRRKTQTAGGSRQGVRLMGNKPQPGQEMP